jgi:hypothetical protein
MLYKMGQEFALRDWPDPHEMAPVNKYAKRVLEYRNLHRYDASFPAHLRNLDNEIFLPAHPNYRRGGRQLPPAEVNPIDEAPRYRLISPVELGGVRHERGAEIAFVWWPTAAMQPINEPAKRIADYLARHENNAKLPRSPWCCYRAAPHLPPTTGGAAAAA